MASGRTLHVRCSTWDQVEVFRTRKLRRGRLLSMKVPFYSEPGAEVTLNLELPNQTVVAIDGKVLRAAPVTPDGNGNPAAAGKPEAGKTWLEVELVGFTEDVVARIQRMAAGEPPEVVMAPVEPEPEPDLPPAPPPPPRLSGTFQVVDELPADERELFQQLTVELRRLRTLAVHEVLGVPRDADAEQIRQGWMAMVRRHHPDLVARRASPAIAHLAEELMILANRAYDRLRVALVAEGRATAVGPVLAPPPGWLVGFDDISSTGSIVRARLALSLQNEGNAEPIAVEPIAVEPTAATPAPVPDGGQAEGGEAFEQRARAMLGDGDADNAQEVLAAALCVYPRSRPLRSLYYVASAISAIGKGEVMLATSQLETALAHHEQCTEAAAILEMLRTPSRMAHDDMRRLFR
ncbi:MAG TPA: J domain-containing protein [Kofleriaceae bacterium]|nr:J domain-containing protein [Kofleriaceae bacterium]